MFQSTPEEGGAIVAGPHTRRTKMNQPEGAGEQGNAQGRASQVTNKEQSTKPKNGQGEKKRNTEQENKQKIREGNREGAERRIKEKASNTPDESKDKGQGNTRDTQHDKNRTERFLKMFKEHRPTREHTQIGPEQRREMLRS